MDWQPPAAPADGLAASGLMAFETPGESFPGSAYYYLDDDSRFDAGVADTQPAVQASPLAGPLAGPVAMRFRLAGSSTDRVRAQQCLTMAIYYESASESDAGQRAVAQVVLNRVAHPSYPNTVCGVVFQGSERSTGCQFSFTCDGSLARKPSAYWWDRAGRFARQALAGAVYAPVGLATHYHTVQVHPYWANSLSNVGTIGAHRFYRWPGAAGQPGAFRAAYRGFEPDARPHARTAGSVAPQDDPVELARAYEAKNAPMLPEASLVRDAGHPSPSPVYSEEIARRGGESLFSGTNLPTGGTIAPRYQRSGEWLTRP